MGAAVLALADTDDPAFEFTGRRFTVPQFSTHLRSESALHRWDTVGDDDISEQLLTQADLTRHAVDLLNTLPLLYEAPEWRAEHAGVTGRLRIVLRSPQTTDILHEHTQEGARFEVVEDGPASGDAVVTTDIANRLLRRGYAGEMIDDIPANQCSAGRPTHCCPVGYQTKLTSSSSAPALS